MSGRRVSLAIIVFGAAAIAVQAQPAEQVVKLANEIEYKAPLNPGAPPAAVVYGDPKKQGLYVTRVKFPMGHKVMPHFHPDERTIVVLSGTYYFGLGEQFDESKMKGYPPGTFLSEPPQAAHYTWAKDGEVIIQVTGYGPSGATQIPQK